MKTILFVTTEVGPGGAEIMLQRLVGRMDRRKFSPVIVTLRSREQRMTPALEAAGIPVHSLGLTSARAFVKGLWRLRRLMAGLRPDVVQGWMYHGNVAATLGLVGSRADIPLYWSIHHSLYSLQDESRSTRAVLSLSRRLASRASGIAYVSTASARHHEAHGFPARLTLFTPNGFDTQRFAPSEPLREQARRELGFEQDSVVIGSLSRYIPVKDHGTLLSAAATLARNYPAVRFLLMGHDVDSHNSELMERLRDLGLESRVRLLGHRPDTHRLLPAMDIFTNSSYSEAFPLAVGEAMACGVACVATDVGDTALLMGDAGIAVAPRDPHALADAWAGLIDGGAAARRALGRLARQRIEENFTLDAAVRRYETLYELGPAPVQALGRTA